LTNFSLILAAQVNAKVYLWLFA